VVFFCLISQSFDYSSFESVTRDPRWSYYDIKPCRTGGVCTTTAVFRRQKRRHTHVRFEFVFDELDPRGSGCISLSGYEPIATVRSVTVITITVVPNDKLLRTWTSRHSWPGGARRTTTNKNPIPSRPRLIEFSVRREKRTNGRRRRPSEPAPRRLVYKTGSAVRTTRARSPPKPRPSNSRTADRFELGCHAGSSADRNKPYVCRRVDFSSGFPCFRGPRTAAALSDGRELVLRRPA